MNENLREVAASLRRRAILERDEAKRWHGEASGERLEHFETRAIVYETAAIVLEAIAANKG